jgi:hypothetical protein
MLSRNEAQVRPDVLNCKDVHLVKAHFPSFYFIFLALRNKAKHVQHKCTYDAKKNNSLYTAFANAFVRINK